MEGRHESLVRLSRAAGAARRSRRARSRVLLAAVMAAALPAVVATAPAAAAGQRAYEMVTPVDKNLGQVAAVVASRPDTVVYTAGVGTDQSRSGAVYPTTLARRSADGWLGFTADPLVEGLLDGSVSTGFAMNFVGLSADESKAIVYTTLPLVPEDTDMYGGDLYLMDMATGVSQLITTGPLDPGVAMNVPDLVGATPDFSHIVFRLSGQLTSDASTGFNVYEWTNGAVRVASILPSGLAAASGIPVQLGFAWTATTNSLGVYLPDSPAAAYTSHPISEDGSRIFFKSGASSYVRIDGTTTVPLSTSRLTSGTPAAGTVGQSSFMGADAAGSVAYFSSNQRLYDAATTGGGVYRYDIDADQLEQITPATVGAVNANVQIGAGISDDGSTLYFVGKGPLTADAVNNQNNLYVWTAGGGTQLVATAVPTETIMRISPDGRYMVFQTTASLGTAQTGGNTELYRYDRDTATVSCVSCRSDGAPSTAAATLNAAQESAHDNPRALTSDGHVIFETPEQLLLEDTNSTEDVYEFDGSSLSMISDGAQPKPSYVGDNSLEGTDVWFRTGESLLPSDTDGGVIDVYDARIGGGFPEPPPPPAPACVGIDCAAAPPARPGVPSPSSTGPGGSNATPEAISLPRLTLLPISGAARRALARRGWASVRVQVTGGGTLLLTGRAPVNGKIRTVTSARRHVTDTGKVTRSVVLRLSTSARRQLSRSGRLSLNLVARIGGLAGPDSATAKLTLKRASR